MPDNAGWRRACAPSSTSASITSGQPRTSLSGGECQRIKLASHLHRQGAIYVLDEPTTGLHMSDVARLLEVLDRLVDERAGTMMVI